MDLNISFNKNYSFRLKLQLESQVEPQRPIEPTRYWKPQFRTTLELNKNLTRTKTNGNLLKPNLVSCSRLLRSSGNPYSNEEHQIDRVLIRFLRCSRRFWWFGGLAVAIQCSPTRLHQNLSSQTSFSSCFLSLSQDLTLLILSLNS